MKGTTMKKITSWLFVTLDGVVEAPENWVMYNEQIGESIAADTEAADTLLLGRNTYEVFAASWPQRTVADDPFADWMNNTPKVVVSTTLDSVDAWQNSSLISGDVAAEIRALKSGPGKDILVNGSPTLVQWLLRNELLDQLRVFLHPIVAGSGKRLFTDDGATTALDLTDSRVLANGVLDLTYTAKTTG